MISICQKTRVVTAVGRKAFVGEDVQENGYSCLRGGFQMCFYDPGLQGQPTDSTLSPVHEGRTERAVGPTDH